MRNWIRYSMLMPVLLVAQVFSACTQGEIPVNESDGPVTVSLAFSLSNASTPQTRMADEVVEPNGSQIRSMIQDVKILPFEATNPNSGVKSGDRLKAFTINGFEETNSQKTDSWFCYFQRCSFMRGTNAVLFYGRANPKLDPLTPSSTVANKAYNGSLIAKFPGDMDPAQIGFELEQMLTTNAAPAEAGTVAAYLTRIANAQGWATATNSRLRALYLNFIGQGNEENDHAVIAGSATSVKAYVKGLKAVVESLEGSDISEIKSAILTAIGTGTPNIGTYPATYGLPDGAAALKWNATNSSFEPQTVTTTITNINNLTRFVYPPELYYFCNSRLHTSKEKVEYSVYSGETKWSNVLSGTYWENAPVSADTKAVVVEKPIQYAVAKLHTSLTYPTSVRDGKDVDISSTIGTMPLTGIIVTGQYNVDYEFNPIVGTESVNRFIYDSNVSGTTANTLLLQSKDGEEVFVILEFLNKTEVAFTGIDGIIYPDTKFYLIGKISPPTKQASDPAYYGRAFTQDHTTEVGMKFDSHALAKAYNVVPNLLAPRLEIGVLLTPDWIASTPTNVPLN